MGPTAEGRVAEGGEAKRDPAAARDAVHDEWDGTGRGSEIGEASAANGVVRTPRFCAECGYALIGLPRDGVCPECRWPVERSLGEPWLARAPEGYLRTVRRGLNWIRAAQVMMWLGWLLPVPIGIIAGSVGYLPAGLAITFCVQDVVGTSVAACGYRWFTSADRDPTISRRCEQARWLVRIGSVGAVTCMLCRMVVLVVVAWANVGTDGLWMTLAVFVALGLGAMGIRSVGASAYVRWLAERVPAPELMLAAERNQWLLPVVWISTVVVCWPWWADIGAIFAPVGPMLALLVYGTMLSILRQHVADAERAARETAPACS